MSNGQVVDELVSHSRITVDPMFVQLINRLNHILLVCVSCPESIRIIFVRMDMQWNGFMERDWKGIVVEDGDSKVVWHEP